MTPEVSAATSTSTAVKRSSLSHSSPKGVDAAVEDRRPRLARSEVVEDDDCAVVHQLDDLVGHRGRRLAGVEEEQREGAPLEQRRPVGGEHFDLVVVGEDLSGGLGQVRVELGGEDPRLRAPYARPPRRRRPLAGSRSHLESIDARTCPTPDGIRLDLVATRTCDPSLAVHRLPQTERRARRPNSSKAWRISRR